MLTNVIGARDQVECRVIERVLGAADTLLLCTDGLHGAVDAATIAAVLRAADPPAVLAERLIQAALERGGGDNITVLVMRYQPDPTAAGLQERAARDDGYLALFTQREVHLSVAIKISRSHGNNASEKDTVSEF